MVAITNDMHMLLSNSVSSKRGKRYKGLSFIAIKLLPYITLLPHPLRKSPFRKIIRMLKRLYIDQLAQ